jgi:hypothetical protein
MKILYFLLLIVSLGESKLLLQSSSNGTSESIPQFFACQPNDNDQQCICTAGNQLSNNQITITNFNKSLTECATRCYSNNRCTYFTWYSPSFNTASLANTCILMTGINYNVAFSKGCNVISNGRLQSFKASSFYFENRADSRPPYATGA